MTKLEELQMIDLENDFESKEILVYRKIALKEIEIEESHRPQVYIIYYILFNRIIYHFGHGLLVVLLNNNNNQKMNGIGPKK